MPEAPCFAALVQVMSKLVTRDWAPYFINPYFLEGLIAVVSLKCPSSRHAAPCSNAVLERVHGWEQTFLYYKNLFQLQLSLALAFCHFLAVKVQAKLPKAGSRAISADN